MTIILPGEPRTKKNSSRIVIAGGRPVLLPSKPYKEYREVCMWKIPGWQKTRINEPVNLQCVYYLGTKRRVDLCNLIEATCDILVDAGVIADDNSKIVVSHDGSRVKLDRDNPRAEITITRMSQ
jgi:Holliday junction resolvase RusA-like endonuclease